MTTTTTTSPDGSPRELAADLVDVYRRCLSARAEADADAAGPKRDAEELAGAILDGVRAHRRRGDGAADASCLALTLVGRTVAAATAGTPRDARFRRDVLEALLRDSDVVSRMVAEFACEHQVLRHLAAKSASACVLYQLRASGEVNPAWRGTCERALLGSPAGPELDSCLWSLTSVLQKLLRDGRQELVGTLVTVFDASVGAAARRFLSADRSALGAAAVADTFCLLLDLLEILAASGDAGSPHLTHVHAAALLAAVDRAPRYFVAKRLALLLKRAALRKAGEDWLDASAESGADVGDLAAAVWDAVAADWLPSVRVESPAFFGGTGRAKGGGGEDGRRDTVMLRAVGLLVIKSVERRAAAAPSGARQHLAGLWRFLRDKGVRPPDAAHDCAVLPLLFGEQDDDLMEAAKASLLTFLRLRDGSAAPPDDPCAAGCNPHCHFLLLLRAIRWDRRILLDFLMSAETCFLEYLLRYLRYLSADRRGFAASCRRLDAEALPRAPSGRRRRRGTVEDAWGRTRHCLLRLRLLLARLHRKNLFPYKADALLRLLRRATPPLGPD